MPLEKTLKGRESIDGSLYDTAHLVRQAVGLAALKGRSITIENIRASSSQFGLDEALMTTIEWLSRVCNASFEGMEYGSEVLRFTPRTNSETSKSEDESSWVTRSTVPGRGMFRLCEIKHETPAPISLTLQAVLPFLVYRPSHPFWLTLEGGTHIPFAPSLSYVEHVLLPNLALIGIPEMRLTRENQKRLCFGSTFKNTGVGKVTIEIRPIDPGETLPEFQTSYLLKSRGPIERLEVIVVGSKLHQETLLDYMADAVDSHTYLKDIEYIERCEDLESKGALCVLLMVVTESGWRLGYEDIIDTDKAIEDLGLSMIANRVVQGLMDELMNRDGSKRNGDFSGLDRWMEDQIVTFQALAAVRRQSGDKPRPFDTPAATESSKSKMKFSTLRRRLGSSGGSMDNTEVANELHEPCENNNPQGILLTRNKENSKSRDIRVVPSSSNMNKNKANSVLFGDMQGQSSSATSKGKDKNGTHDGSKGDNSNGTQRCSKGKERNGTHDYSKARSPSPSSPEEDEDAIQSCKNGAGSPTARTETKRHGSSDNHNGQHTRSSPGKNKENNGNKTPDHGEHGSSKTAKDRSDDEESEDIDTSDNHDGQDTGFRIRKKKGKGKAKKTEEVVSSATGYRAMARRAPTLQTQTTMWVCDRILDVAFSHEGLCNGCERAVKLRSYNYRKPAERNSFLQQFRFGSSSMG